MDYTHEDERVAADKRALRGRVLAGRAALAPGELAAAGDAIAAELLGLPSVAQAQVVAAYAALPTEVPTHSLLHQLQARDVAVLLPVLEAGNSLSWRTLGSGGLAPGRRGVLEPAGGAGRGELHDAQVVIVPGLCFDLAGRRLGRGGGSYDRALASLSSSVPTIGIALDRDVIDTVPVQHHDQTVDMIVTPTRVITIDDGGS